MDWKKRYAQIIVGDKVKVLKPNHLCKWLPTAKCCEKFAGQICEVTEIENINDDTKGTITILTPNNDRCTFPKECLQKV